MARQNDQQNDQWDIVSSVGWTALMVTAGRAVDTRRPDRLVNDPFAERFVDRADTPLRLPTRPGEPWPDPERSGTEETALDEFWPLMAAYQGVRSRFFDTALLRAAEQGVPQVVLLAAGLDARGYRLEWPAGTTAYEVDQPRVLEFKDAVLGEEGAVPGCARVEVPVDLREDWPAALADAGFDPARPSAWLMEGLLPFLPAEAEAELLRRVGSLAAPGSSLFIEHFAPALDQLRTAPALARFGRAFGIELPELFHLREERPHPADRLAGGGWEVTAYSAAERARTYGRPLPSMSDGTSLDTELLGARR